MLIYSVNVTIKKEIEEEWLKWMKEVHLSDVISTGYFNTWKLFKIIIPASTNDEVSYSVQYSIDSLIKYEDYAKNHASALQAEHANKFPGKFKAARALLEDVS